MAGEKLKCTCCGKVRAIEKNYYRSYSTYNSYEGLKDEKRITICKDCTKKRYEQLVETYQDELKALYHLCMNLDIYYGNDLATSIYAKSNNEEGKFLREYFKSLNSLSQYKGLTSLDSDMMILDENLVKDLVIEEEEVFEITSEILKRWGRGYTTEEYQELEERYQEWLDHYDHETLVLEKLFRELSEFELLKNRARNSNDNKTFKDLSELISKKMGDADIKPTQKKAMADGESETYGTMVEDIEKTEPCLVPSTEFEDVDKIYYYITKYFVKPFARVMGLAEANNQGEIELKEDFANSLKEGEDNED